MNTNSSTNIIAIGIGDNLNLINLVNQSMSIASIDDLSPASNNAAINASNYARDQTCASMPYQG
jgi:hypothetical protein